MCISKAGKINHTVIYQGHLHSCIKCYGYMQIIIQIYVQITFISESPRFQTQARGYTSAKNLVKQEIRVFYKARFEGFEFFIRWPYAVLVLVLLAQILGPFGQT